MLRFWLTVCDIKEDRVGEQEGEDSGGEEFQVGRFRVGRSRVKDSMWEDSRWEGRCENARQWRLFPVLHQVLELLFAQLPILLR